MERFPEAFHFQLTENEYLRLQKQTAVSDNKSLRFQIGTSNNRGGRRYLPFVFTEQGVAMLSAVLHSETAVKVSIQIMEAFVAMKKFINTNAAIFQRLDKIEKKQIESDTKLDQVFQALEEKTMEPKQGIFFDGQIFDAYSFVADLIRSAEKSIVLIDNYVDDSVLTLFTKRKPQVKVTIFTARMTKQLSLDLKRYNKQYPAIQIKVYKNAHDRFLILDETTVYHFGASLKDLGKKWFAFSKFDKEALTILDKQNG